MKKIIFTIWLLLLLPLAGNAADDEYKPFVSKLKASVMGSGILLTWENTENTDKMLVVMRHTEEISITNAAQAVIIARSDSTKQSYIYYPEDTNEYYFAVNYLLSTGEPNGVYIAYRNVTTKAVGVKTVGTEEELATKISGIASRAGEDSITVMFKSSKPERELILYRSTSPVYTTDDLLAANFYLALDKYTTAYIDYPIPDLDYYYAVLDAGLAKIGIVELVKGDNTTVSAARIKTSGKPAGTGLIKSQRTSPLPLLSISANVESGNQLVSSVSRLLPGEKTVSDRTKGIVNTLLAEMTLAAAEKKALLIMDLDKVEDKLGEAYTLQTIIKDYLSPGDYKEAGKAIDTFLRIKHSAEVEARAHFYLGQIYYFQEKYEEALLEFLIVSDIYYEITQPWIDSCFEFLI